LVVGVHDKYDLAMLKINASDLKPIHWRHSKQARVGAWLATPGTDEDALAVGVVSVATRRPQARDMPPPNPPEAAGYLGVLLEPDDGGPRIRQVVKDSAAEKAGLKVGDVVLSVSGRKVLDMETLINVIQRYKPGQEVVLKIQRGKEALDLK